MIQTNPNYKYVKLYGLYTVSTAAVSAKQLPFFRLKVTLKLPNLKSTAIHEYSLRIPARPI